MALGAVFVWGIAAFALVPPLQHRVVLEARDAPHLASTLNQSAFNLGDALGAALGAAMLAPRIGLPVAAVDRRRRRRPCPRARVPEQEQPTIKDLMQTSLDRRLFCLGAFAAAAGCAPALAMQPDEGFASIERRHGGRLGVMVVETGLKRMTGHRADERFLLESTFKGPLAAMVLARIDAGAEALDRPVRYGRDDLLPGAPVTTAHVPAGTLTVGQLVAAILEHSDNTAANLLLRRVGGAARAHRLAAWDR